jgi:hypothetical protein
VNIPEWNKRLNRVSLLVQGHPFIFCSSIKTATFSRSSIADSLKLPFVLSSVKGEANIATVVALPPSADYHLIFQRYKESAFYG